MDPLPLYIPSRRRSDVLWRGDVLLDSNVYSLQHCDWNLSTSRRPSPRLPLQRVICPPPHTVLQAPNGVLRCVAIPPGLPLRHTEPRCPLWLAIAPRTKRSVHVTSRGSWLSSSSPQRPFSTVSPHRAMGNTVGNGVYVDLAAGPNGVGLYLPGETVKGTVHLQVQNELHVKGVFLKVVGGEQSEGKDQDRTGATFTGKIGTADYFEHKYFKHSVPLLEPTPEGTVTVGQYSVPFTFTLPNDLPPSIAVGGYGWKCIVEYRVKAVCKLAGMKSKLKDIRRFNVLGVVPRPPSPVSLHDSKKVHRLGRLGDAGSLQVDLHLDQDVWLAGSPVKLNSTITNDSKKVVDNINFKIERIVTLHGHIIKTDVSQATVPGIGPNAKSEDLRVGLALPTDLAPTCTGKGFALRYAIAVDCDISHVKDPEAHVDIVVHVPHGSATAPAHPQPVAPPKWEPSVLKPVVVPSLLCMA